MDLAIPQLQSLQWLLITFIIKSKLFPVASQAPHYLICDHGHFNTPSSLFTLWPPQGLSSQLPRVCAIRITLPFSVWLPHTSSSNLSSHVISTEGPLHLLSEAASTLQPLYLVFLCFLLLIMAIIIITNCNYFVYLCM